MSHIVKSLENAVEAGVQSIIGIAEGITGAGPSQPPSVDGTDSADGAADPPTTSSPIPIAPAPAAGSADPAAAVVLAPTHALAPAHPHPNAAPPQQHHHHHHHHHPLDSLPPASLATRLALASQQTLVQLTDVPSGWIHLQSTYLDSAGGQRRVRSFGLRNISEAPVNIEVASDLAPQVVFWVAADHTDDDKALSSASSASSSAPAGLTSLSLALPPDGTTTVSLAFQPSTSPPATPPGNATPSTDGGFTPRVLPTSSSTDPSPVSRLPSAAGTSILSDTTNASAVSNSSYMSGGGGGGGGVGGSSGHSRRLDPIYRSFSVHGSVLVRATTAAPPWDTTDVFTPAPAPQPHQNITLPFFATVCRSFFSAALIDPATGVASGGQLSSGELLIDFGTDNLIGQEVHRDIVLVNRSEIDLVWNSAIVRSRFKDKVWFSLRDLDSENVFGIDTSSEPVPLPALSSRHLRLSLRATASVADFDFEFIISNLHQSSNHVTVRATGSCANSAHDETLHISSGSWLDFGQVPDGSWAKKLITAKNMGDRPIDVHFSATPGYEVAFRLAGVAGEDIDEDIPVRPRDKRNEALSRAPTRDLSRTRDPSSSSRYDVISPGAAALAAAAGPVPSGIAAGIGGRSRLPTDGSAAGSSDMHGWEDGSAVGISDRDSSMAASRPLSRVTSRTSSYRPEQGDGDSDEDLLLPPGDFPSVVADLTRRVDIDIPNQIEELTMRPGTEYRVSVMYRPARDLINPPEVAGSLRTSSFKLFLDWTLSSQRSRPAQRTRQTVSCVAESCTSIIRIPSGHLIDFGEVTVGASKSTIIQIENLSALSARVEIAAISKVLNTNRNVIVIPPYETVSERLDFFPRRINDRYEKQVFVRNHLNRENNQLIEIHSKNVDVYNVTLHSHLYRILTPSGRNFLDFGSVVINSPQVRTVQFQNLTHKPLVLELGASQPEDVELYIKAEDLPCTPARAAVLARYAAQMHDSERSSNTRNLKERFMESLQEQSANESKPLARNRIRDKSVTRAVKDGDKMSVGASTFAALKKGNRGKHVQLYGNAVVFKDRNLLDDHEYLDLASGPPISAHRVPPHSKRNQLLETIALEDKSVLSGQHPRVPKLDFAASAKSSGLYKRDTTKMKKTKSSTGAGRKEPSTPSKSHVTGSRAENSTSPSKEQQLRTPVLRSHGSGTKSPALTGKRAEFKGPDLGEEPDITKLTVDQLIVALEQQDAKRTSSAVTHLDTEEEEQYVRRLIALRKELQAAITSAKIVPARVLTVPPGTSRQLIVVQTPNGSTRPHVTTRAKRAESRIYIKLLEYDHSLLTSAVGKPDLCELPVRDLVIRSSCVRSVLEVQQSSINFGSCERGEVKSRTIVIHNRSDTVGVFRMRTSGSIASGNLKLGVGRYGVISAFGRKEVASFSFTPSMVGNYQETIAVENVLDSFNDQNVQVKATVRKMPAFSLDTAKLDFVPQAVGEWPAAQGFVITNTSKTDRTFAIEAAAQPAGAFAELTLARDEKDAGQALSKGEEEEVEALLQKLKIARRKVKPEKIAKYEKRLGELGVVTTPLPEAAADTGAESSTPETPAAAAADGGDDAATPAAAESAKATSSLTVTLQANKKAKILVELVPRDGAASLATAIRVYEKKNTDELVTIDVAAQPNPNEVVPAPEKTNTSQDPLYLAIMRHCLGLTLECPVSQTAFCVGSTLFLPVSSPLFDTLKAYFPVFPHPVTGEPAGLLLADGYSRQIPGNTHAEANALTNFRERMSELEARAGADAAGGAEEGDEGHAAAAAPEGASGADAADDAAAVEAADPAGARPNGAGATGLPTAADILAQAECFATMEPCSVRTSGGPSCALELVRAHVNTVFLGVEEPPDFVQCEGVHILEQGGVAVRRVVGLEDECLTHARRGRS